VPRRSQERSGPGRRRAHRRHAIPSHAAPPLASASARHGPALRATTRPSGTSPRSAPTVRRPRLRFVTARPQPGSSGSSPWARCLGVGDGGVQPARGFDKMGAWSQPGTARIRAADPNPGGPAARVSAAAVPGRTGPARSARRGSRVDPAGPPLVRHGRHGRAGGRHAARGRNRRRRTGPPGAARPSGRMPLDVARRGGRRRLAGRGVRERSRRRRTGPLGAARPAARMVLGVVRRGRRPPLSVVRRKRRVGAVGRDVVPRGERRAA
jgi:hypothetical protein